MSLRISLPFSLAVSLAVSLTVCVVVLVVSVLVLVVFPPTPLMMSLSLLVPCWMYLSFCAFTSWVTRLVVACFMSVDTFGDENVPESRAVTGMLSILAASAGVSLASRLLTSAPRYLAGTFSFRL